MRSTKWGLPRKPDSPFCDYSYILLIHVPANSLARVTDAKETNKKLLKWATTRASASVNEVMAGGGRRLDDGGAG